jgi:hypothetical protein
MAECPERFGGTDVEHMVGDGRRGADTFAEFEQVFAIIVLPITEDRVDVIDGTRSERTFASRQSNGGGAG